ncbi:MAG: hypothetical protein IJJ33_06280 [Victivallales bacterium]|nr:hypothetical protein [Victivallales bacterium]
MILTAGISLAHDGPKPLKGTSPCGEESFEAFVKTTDNSAPPPSMVQAKERNQYTCYTPVYNRPAKAVREAGPPRRIIGYRPSVSIMGGGSFDRGYTAENARPGQTGIVLIGGVWSGEGPNALSAFLPKRLPRDRYAVFRYEDIDKARQYINDLYGRGAKVLLIGHSRGGDVADQLGAGQVALGREIDVHLFDPVSVSVFHRNKEVRTPGAKVYLPDDSTASVADKLAPTIGGRFKRPKNFTLWKGNHNGDFRKLFEEAIFGKRQGEGH